MTRIDILREIYRVQAMINSPEGKGKRTALEAYYRKLHAQYLKAHGVNLPDEQVSA